MSDFADAARANILALEVLDVLSLAAEDAGGGVLFENNALSVYIDFQGVLLIDVQGPAQFHGQYHPTELIDLSDNSCRFH
jgi:hypothetical protein